MLNLPIDYQTVVACDGFFLKKTGFQFFCDRCIESTKMLVKLINLNHISYMDK